MRDLQILVSPFSFIDILKLEVNKVVNEHFTAEIVGHVSAEDGDKYVQTCTASTGIHILSTDEDGNKKTLFKGLVQDIWTDTVAGLKTLHVEAVSRSVLLDQKEHIRTFQNESQSYQSVCEVIRGDNGGATFIYTTGSQSTDGILVQFEETDWEFLKRIASKLNSVIVPDCVNDNLCLCFGVPRKAESFAASSPTYRIEKELGEYLYKKQNKVASFTEQDATNYIVDSREMWEICSEVSFLGRSMYVYKVRSSYTGQELVHTYWLRTMDGFKTKKQYNLKLIGVSLNGRISSIRNDLVKLEADLDENTKGGPDKWFTYSTVYSNPDGTGWYCMPEKKDAARLYFPDEREENAYVVSAVHVGKQTKHRTDPDTKTLRTVHGKEVKFTPHTLKMTNNKGMSVILDDEKGISIVSNKDITLQSSKNIHLNSSTKVNIQGKNGVNMRQKDSQINITEDLHELAQGVYHK